ncbi:MAG: hypothetical protein IJ833_03425 [Lachnospiraceae bacterium]|nr:hypothetical protein [Lachnospiraceae bacterium]
MADVGQELLNVPFPEMVVKLASAIAEGQYQLDLVSCEIAKLMSTNKVTLPSLTEADGEYETTMLGAGFQPTFYQFTDTIIEVKMAISMSKTTEKSVSASAKAKFGCFSASVNASYSSKYSYSVEGSSLLRTKITPVPPNSFLQNYLDLKSELMQKEIKELMGKTEEALNNEEGVA